MNRLVKSVNNRCALSQRKLGRRFRVHQWTISCNLRQRTSVIIRKRKKAPKMDSEEQQRRARKNCGKLYRKLLNDYDLIIDDEKFLNYLEIMSLETDTSIQLIHLLLLQIFDFNKRLNSNQR